MRSRSKICEINSLASAVTSFVKTLIWRKICSMFFSTLWSVYKFLIFTKNCVNFRKEMNDNQTQSRKLREFITSEYNNPFILFSRKIKKKLLKFQSQFHENSYELVRISRNVLRSWQIVNTFMLLLITVCYKCNPGFVRRKN